MHSIFVYMCRSVIPTIDFGMALFENFQKILLWRTFYSLHGLFNNILLNNSGIKLYMLIWPAFIHAPYYIRNSISAEPRNRTRLTIVSFLLWLLQFSIICLDLPVREKWRNHWSELALMVLKWDFCAISSFTFRGGSLQNSSKQEKKRIF